MSKSQRWRPLPANLGGFDAPAASCFSKTAYPSEQKARRASNRVHDERGVRLRVYACTLCGSYHLTRREADDPQSSGLPH